MFGMKSVLYYTTIPRRGGEKWWIYTETRNDAPFFSPLAKQ